MELEGGCSGTNSRNCGAGGGVKGRLGQRTGSQEFTEGLKVRSEGAGLDLVMPAFIPEGQFQGQSYQQDKCESWNKGALTTWSW